MGPLLKLLAKMKEGEVLKHLPNYSQFLNDSGVQDITLPRTLKAAHHYIKNRDKFGDHAVIDNRLKDYSQKHYGYNPKVKAARSMLGARDYARRFPIEDEQILKDQAVLYQLLQGLGGLDFEGDSADALYNKLGIDQAVAENNSSVPLHEMDFDGIEELFEEFENLMR